jgi:2-C-methyl-D-erythritol 4-phosphate cytidylyltransferase
MRLAALVPVVGDGRRQQAKLRKPYQLLEGRPVLAHTLERLERCGQIDDIYPIVPPEDLSYVRDEIVAAGRYQKVAEVLVGGLLRQDSIYKALMRLREGYDLVMVHDGNRPLVPDELLNRTIAAAEVHGAAIAAVPVHDTIKSITKSNFVASSYDRRRLRGIQTPHVFRHDILMRAYALATRENFYGSDDAVLVERLGEKIKVVAGSRINLYVASREDLSLARALLRVEQEYTRAEFAGPGGDGGGSSEWREDEKGTP